MLCEIETGCKSRESQLQVTEGNCGRWRQACTRIRTRTCRLRRQRNFCCVAMLRRAALATEPSRRLYGRHARPGRELPGIQHDRLRDRTSLVGRRRRGALSSQARGPSRVGRTPHKTARLRAFSRHPPVGHRVRSSVHLKRTLKSGLSTKTKVSDASVALTSSPF